MAAAASTAAAPQETDLINQKMVFGITIDRLDVEEMDELIDDIYDQLSDDGFTESDWDMLAWFRGSTAFLIMYAPLLTRASLQKVDGIDCIRPLTHTAATMMDNRNTWFLPLRSNKQQMTAAELAAETLTTWQAETYAAFSGTTGSEDEGEDLDQRIHEVSSAPLPRRTKKKPGALAPASELMAMLNLKGATDTGGKEFVFGAED